MECIREQHKGKYIDGTDSAPVTDLPNSESKSIKMPCEHSLEDEDQDGKEVILQPNIQKLEEDKQADKTPQTKWQYCHNKEVRPHEPCEHTDESDVNEKDDVKRGDAIDLNLLHDDGSIKKTLASVTPLVEGDVPDHDSYFTPGLQGSNFVSLCNQSGKTPEEVISDCDEREPYFHARSSGSSRYPRKKKKRGVLCKKQQVRPFFINGKQRKAGGKLQTTLIVWKRPTIQIFRYLMTLMMKLMMAGLPQNFLRPFYLMTKERATMQCKSDCCRNVRSLDVVKEGKTLDVPNTLENQEETHENREEFDSSLALSTTDVSRQNRPQNLQVTSEISQQCHAAGHRHETTFTEILKINLQQQDYIVVIAANVPTKPHDSQKRPKAETLDQSVSQVETTADVLGQVETIDDIPTLSSVFQGWISANTTAQTSDITAGTTVILSESRAAIRVNTLAPALESPEKITADSLASSLEYEKGTKPCGPNLLSESQTETTPGTQDLSSESQITTGTPTQSPESQITTDTPTRSPESQVTPGTSVISSEFQTEITVGTSIQSSEFQITTGTPTQSPESQITTGKPSLSPESHITTGTPTQSSESQVITGTPTQFSKSQIPTDTPTKSPESQVITGTPTQSHITTGTPIQSSESHITTSTPTQSSESHITTSTPTQSSESQVTTSTTTQSSESQVTTDTPTQSPESQITTGTAVISSECQIEIAASTPTFRAVPSQPHESQSVPTGSHPPELLYSRGESAASPRGSQVLPIISEPRPPGTSHIEHRGAAAFNAIDQGQLSMGVNVRPLKQNLKDGKTISMPRILERHSQLHACPGTSTVIDLGDGAVKLHEVEPYVHSKSSEIRQAFWMVDTSPSPPMTSDVMEHIRQTFRARHPAAWLQACLICQDNRRSCVLLNCMHCPVCYSCASLVNVCPVCECAVIRFVRIY